MTDPEAEFLATLPAIEDNATLEYGVVTAVNGPDTVTVNLSGVTSILPFLNSYPANVGDSAAVIRIGLYAVAVGATSRATPVLGTVTSVGVNTVTVTVNGVTGLVMRYLASYAPTNGDVVWVSDGGVLGEFASAPPAPAAPPPVAAPPPPAAGGTEYYAARDAGSFRNGSWRSDASGVFQGSTGSGANSGAWFIGSGPNDQLAGATIHSAEIYLHRIQGSGDYAAQNVHLYLHTSVTRPGGDVTRTSGPRDRALAVNDAGWYDLGADWGAALAAATGRGFGVTGDPYLQLASLAANPQSGTVRISWSR